MGRACFDQKGQGLGKQAPEADETCPMPAVQRQQKTFVPPGRHCPLVYDNDRKLTSTTTKRKQFRN